MQQLEILRNIQKNFREIICEIWKVVQSFDVIIQKNWN